MSVNQTMEDILDSLNNPFDFDGFINLLNLYLNSKDWNEFYSSVVTKYQDRSMESSENYSINIKNEFIKKEYMGSLWVKYEYFSKIFPTEHRIYINSSLDASSKIVEAFMTECDKDNIPFELKYAIEKNNRSDGIVIGGNSTVFKKQIDILRKIAKEHPEFIKECGTPHMLTSKLDGWMGIADENIDNRYHSYTQSRLGLIMSACKKYLLKHVEYKDKIAKYDLLVKEYKSRERLVENRIKSGKIPEAEKEANISKELTKKFVYYSYSYEIDLNEFSNIIKNSEATKELYDIFLEECNNIGIDPNMPALYKGSKEDLLKAENPEKEANINFQGKNLSELFEYTLGEFSTETKVEIIKEIEDKMYEYLTLLSDSIEYKQLLLNSNEEFESNLFSIISETMDKGNLAKRDKSYKSKNELIFGKAENVDNRQAQELFTKQKEKVLSFFENGLDSKEEIEKSVSELNLIIEKYKKDNPDPDFNYELVKILEMKRDFLQFEVSHYEEMSKYFEENSKKIGNVEYTAEKLEELFLKGKANYRPTNIDFENQIGLARIAEGMYIEVDEKDKADKLEESKLDDLY